ncbi:related to cytochrome P450 CYP4/CYP19/CYP26 subfamilies [Fusarium torulosum]|uniref:Related to cytochrome P450 CYP4/CYP19/CYP26 subfamilies n=1 Tax=Fusarium torulosum TaxID=33205 RepID=A0AAE8M5U0_9HYPO|nr:related to cytochrome P450 CYP4/CYP19/CYP26 subfamilies [Fusarium torulosum]
MYPFHVEILVFLGIAFLLWLLQALLRVRSHQTYHIPGPWLSNITGAAYYFHFLRGSRCQYIHGLHQKYGPVVRVAPGVIDLASIQALKTIYGSREQFRKSQYYRLLAVSDQQGLFNTVDVEFHRRHRRLLAGPMAESALWKIVPVVESRLDLTLSRMKEEMASRGAADVYKWWIFMATDIIGELTFGDSFRMLELGRKNEYIHELEAGSFVGALRATFPFWVRVCSVIPIPVFRRVRDAGDRMTKYATDSVDRYRLLVDSGSDKAQVTLFSKLFKARGEGTMPFNEIRDEALNYIAAGSDTVSVTMTYLTWHLSRNTDIRDELIKELRALPSDFDAHQLRDLPFLNAVINETLRIYSAAPGPFPRLVPPEGADIAGYHIAGGVEVSAQAYSLHRDPSIFPDPDDFKPSRWASPTAEMNDAFTPFGRGARVCIGQHLARIELRLATARFFLAFPQVRMSSIDDEIGVTSAALVSIGSSLSDRILTSFDKSMITSATALFALIAAPLASVLADKVGRRRLMLYADILFIVASITLASCTVVGLAIVGRCLIGVAGAFSSIAVPLYISEISPASHRGMLITATILLVTVGQIIGFLIASIFTAWAPERQGWRWTFGLGVVPSAAQAIIISFMPDTPRWLIMVGRLTAAKRVLQRIYGNDDDAERLTDQLINNIQSDARELRAARQQRAFSRSGRFQWLNPWRELLSQHRYRRALATAILLLALQQLCGFNSLMYFSATIFKMVGFENPTLASLAIASTNFIFTTVSLAVIDTVGRRRMLLRSMPFMILGLFLAATGFSYLPISISPPEGRHTSDNSGAARLVL